MGKKDLAPSKKRDSLGAIILIIVIVIFVLAMFSIGLIYPKGGN